MRRTGLVFLSVLLFAATLTAAPSIVLVSGRVFTGDTARPWAEAVAIEGNRISAVGTNAQIRALADDKTQVIDAGGRLVIPGINDAHMHPGFATHVFGINRGFDPSRAEIEPAIANAIDETPGDVWITVTIGPSILLDPAVNAQSLDKVARNRPVLMASWTGHGAILNSAAMKALGIAPDATDPNGGWYGRGANGQLDGRVFEYAQYPLHRKLADMASDDDLVESIRTLSEEALAHGITSVQAMPAGKESRFAAALARANVPLRVRIIDFLDHGDIKTDAVKWIADGTPLERNAALRSKYAAGGQGRENFSDLTPLVRAAADAKQQILIHAVGDRTVESALKAFAKYPALQRPRLEHADGLQRDLFALAKQTGAIVVQNPSHFSARPFFPAEGEYQLVRSLLKAGIPLALGSDGPMNPYLNMLWATQRSDTAAEALTMEEAVRAYTFGSAYAEMKEKQKGTLAPGMLADLAVLSQDIFKVAPPALPETRSVLTMIDGKVVRSELP